MRNQNSKVLVRGHNVQSQRLLADAWFLLALGVVLAGGMRVQGQSFTNLNFESATGPNANQPALEPVLNILQK